jgi:protein-disulfide isomerase
MRSPRQVSFGPANAKRVLVEFMDYNCGFCRRAHEDKFRLLAADAELRVIVRELPVLGPGSVEAAQVASALRMQDTGGALYARFHGQMMQLSGPASRATALQTAREAGADMIRLEADLASPEVAATIEESRDLARQLGISGTPSYIAEGRLIVGAVGPDILRKALQKLD